MEAKRIAAGLKHWREERGRTTQTGQAMIKLAEKMRSDAQTLVEYVKQTIGQLEYSDQMKVAEHVEKLQTFEGKVCCYRVHCKDYKSVSCYLEYADARDVAKELKDVGLHPHVRKFWPDFALMCCIDAPFDIDEAIKEIKYNRTVRRAAEKGTCKRQKIAEDDEEEQDEEEEEEDM